MRRLLRFTVHSLTHSIVNNDTEEDRKRRQRRRRKGQSEENNYVAARRSNLALTVILSDGVGGVGVVAFYCRRSSTACLPAQVPTTWTNNAVTR